MQVPGSTNRVAAVWYSATSFTVDVNLGDGQTHDLELYFLDWDSKGRERAGADQRRRHGQRAGHRNDLVVHQRRLPGLEGLGQPGDHDHPAGRGQCRAQRGVPRLDVVAHAHRDRKLPPAGHDDAGKLDRHLRRPGLRYHLRPDQPPGQRHGHAQQGESTYTWTTTSTDPRALQVPGSTNRVAAVWYSATSFTVDVNLGDGQTHDLELYFLDWDSKGRSEQVQISDAGTGNVLDTETISSFTNGVYLDWKVSGNLLITITRQAGANAVLNGVFLDAAPVGGTAYQVATASSVNTGSR